MDAFFLKKFDDLLSVQFIQSEHAVHAPHVVLVTERGQLLWNAVVHLLHAVGRATQVQVPHETEPGVSEDDVDDVGAADGRVRVDELNLRG